MTDEQIQAYVRDVVEAMGLGELIEYATLRLTEYYMYNRDLAEEEAKEFYS